MSSVIDLSHMFRPKAHIDADKENIHVNSNSFSGTINQNNFKDDGENIQKLGLGNSCSIMAKNETLHWQDQCLTLAADCDSLRYRIHNSEKEKERDALKIAGLSQEIIYANSKMAAVTTDHKSQKRRWLTEQVELEGKVFQLIAAQTQYQGSLKKKEKEFEKLQSYLQKQVSSSKGTNTANSSGAGTKSLKSTSSYANATDSVSSSMIITKPLPSNSSQSQITNGKASSTNAAVQLLKDLEVMGLKQIIADLQRENVSLKINMDRLSNESRNEVGNNTNANSDRNVNFNLRDVLLLQSRVADLEQTLSDMKHQKEMAEIFSKKRDRGQPTTTTACDTAVGENVDIDDVPVVSEEVRTLVNDSIIVSNMVAGSEAELLSLREQLRRAWLMINKQDAVVHEALRGRLEGVFDIITQPVSATKSSLSENYCESPVCKKSKTAIASSSINNDDLDTLFELPPASPATIALLKECGWEDLPPLAVVEANEE